MAMTLQRREEYRQQGLQSLTPEALQTIQQMVHDLNELLQKHQRGEDTEGEFEDFMKKWGQFFPDGIENVDQSGGCSYGYSCTYTDSLSWASPTQPLPMVRDPRVVFDSLFGVGATPGERRERQAEDKSLLDWFRTPYCTDRSIPICADSVAEPVKKYLRSRSQALLSDALSAEPIP